MPKRLSQELVAAVLLLGAGVLTARAEIYLNVDCYCDPKNNAASIPGPDEKTVVGCICSESYTLPKLGTKDFRFHCKNANANVLPQYEVVADRDKPTTCTIEVEAAFAHDYVSKSCTNWSALSTDTVKLQTVCTAR